MMIKSLGDIDSLNDARTMGIMQQAAKYKSTPAMLTSICNNRHLHSLTMPNA